MEISREQFTHVGTNTQKAQAIVRPSMTYWQDAWRRLKMSKVTMVSLGLIILLILMAIVAPFLTKHTYYDNNLSNINQMPNAEHWFGTDTLGRDMWARIWAGGRISLFIGFVCTFLEGTIGMLVGGASGYFGGKLDMFIMRTVDVLMGIPALIIIILVSMVMGTGLNAMIFAIVISGWFAMARLVRGQVFSLKEQEFVLAAKTLGASSSRLILKHLIPNCLGVIIVSLTFRIPGNIFYEAFLSFIGLGVQPPMTSWGQLAAAGTLIYQTQPLQMFLPSVVISLTMLSLQLLGDGLRDALDPKLRK
ncbi:MAG: ABC transporter permease [Bacillota bacterium]